MFGLSHPKPDLIVHSTHPLNAEPPLERLRSTFLTAAGDFYIRSHGDLPDLDPATHRVTVDGRVSNPLSLSVADLQARFAERSLVAVMQCAGNRRADLQQVRPTKGDPWAPGAIGNARWTGVALVDVLQAAGAEEDASLHVAFEGADVAKNEGSADAPFGVSVPMPKAVSGDVLLAWAMNGEALSREHGAPLRVVVPGYAGVRSAKWVRTITVQDEPSRAFQQRQDYLLFPPDADTTNKSLGTPITEMPLNAAICEPASGAILPAGPTVLRGYAIATDRAIIRVEVSADGGRTWAQATIENHGNARWGWTLWCAEIAVTAGEHELVVRAWDAAGQTQPSKPDEVWNIKGYLCAAWHRVKVTVR